MTISASTHCIFSILNFYFSQKPVITAMFPHRFSMMSFPLCDCGCPCMCLTTVASTTASSCSRSWSLSSLSRRPPPPILPSTTPAQSPAAALAITAKPRLMECCQELRQLVRRRGSPASPQLFNSSTRRWSCAPTWSTPSRDMRHSGVTGKATEVNGTQDFNHRAVT